MFKDSDCMFGARIIKIVNWCQEMLHSRTALVETAKTSVHVHTARRFILLYSAKNGKRIGSEIRKLRVFKYSDCTFGARVSKTVKGSACLLVAGRKN